MENSRLDVMIRQAESGVASVPVNDEWRRWIAENLMLGADAGSLVQAMTANGISREDALHEVGLALESPYLGGAQLLRNRLRKRDWLSARYGKIKRLHPLSGESHRPLNV